MKQWTPGSESPRAPWRWRGPAQAEAPKPILVNGAKLVVELAGERRTVRLIGLFAPADGACLPRRDVDEFAARLDSPLTMESDPAVPAEARGELYRYVSDSVNDLGADSVKAGLAIPGSAGYSRASRYSLLAATAKANRRGLWAPQCQEALATILSPTRRPALPRGDAAAAQEAIAELHARNESGENVVRHEPPSAAYSPSAPPALQPARRETAGKEEESAQRPGEARELSGPRIRDSGAGSVTVSGKYWNPGDTEVRGRLRIELRDGTSIVDSTYVQMTLPPDGEREYSVTLSPGLTSTLVAVVTWQGR